MVFGQSVRNVVKSYTTVGVVVINFVEYVCCCNSLYIDFSPSPVLLLLLLLDFVSFSRSRQRISVCNLFPGKVEMDCRKMTLANARRVTKYGNISLYGTHMSIYTYVCV